MSITRWNPILLLGMSIVIPAGIPMGIAAAQSQTQGDSLADAARRAQAEQKNQPTAQKVWTTENIPTTPGYISIVGIAAPPPAAKDDSAPDTPAGKSDKADKRARSERSRATIQSELDSAKLDLNTVTTDLDILTRKHVLDSQTYYSKPNYSSDTQGAAQLQDEQDEIDAKKQQVDDAQKKVNDLQDELNALTSDQGATTDSSDTTGSSSPASQDPPSDVSSGNNSNPLTINPTLQAGRK